MNRPDHRPTALTLQKSRVSAWLQLIVSSAFGMGGMYVSFLAYSLGGDLGGLMAGLFAFSTFCVSVTFIKAALDTLNHQGPWLVIDQHGITDVARNIGPVPWHPMQLVTLDNYESRIVINFHRNSSSPYASGRWTSLIRRWQNGGDFTFSLGGMAYDTGTLKATLDAFHAATKPPSQ